MSFSIPCRICQKAVHGDHDGKGYKVGSYKFAVCLDHVAAIERSRAAAVEGARFLAREMIRRKLPLTEDFYNE